MDCRLHFSRFSRISFAAISLSLLILTLSCDEPLPPRVLPEKVVQASFNFYLLPDSIVFLTKNSVNGSVGSVDIKELNLIDEVLEDEEQVQAEVEIYMKDHPERRVVVRATKDDIYSWRVLLGNQITVAVHDTVEIMKQWSHATEDGTPFWTFVSPTSIMTRGGQPVDAYIIHFVAGGTVKIFKSRPTEHIAYQEFVVKYVLR